jgi:hypothetical protein
MDNDVLTTLKILIVGDSGVGKSRLVLLDCNSQIEAQLNLSLYNLIICKNCLKFTLSTLLLIIFMKFSFVIV